MKQDFLSLENGGYIGHKVSKQENNELGNKKMVEMTCKKCIKKTPERQFLLIQKDKFSIFSARCQPW